MTFTTINIHNFRNFHAITLYASSHFNLIYGENGSGKTSLLEAIYYLSHGRSFRSHLSDRVIRLGEQSTTLFAELFVDLKRTVGIERNHSGDHKIKIDQQMAKTAAELAVLLPVLVINPDSFALLDGGPKHRRALLDWGLFHVEHPFFVLWQRLQRALKQRNAALRLRLPYSQISIWDEELITYSMQLDTWRAEYCKQLAAVFNEMMQQLEPINGITLDYQRGWTKGRDLRELLGEHLPQDYERGFTFYGSHRADLVLKKQGLPLQDILSRGQQKLVVCALKLAQGAILHAATGKRSIYLIDDLPAELGSQYRNSVISLLIKQNSQVFITALERIYILESLKDTSCKEFHVEQGILLS